MKLARPHKFWDEQPVHHFTSDDVCQKDGPIKTFKVADISREAITLPQGFEWVTLDLSNEEVIDQLFSLLRDHYVEDNDGVFRFEYSVSFLKWALCVPGYNKEWHVGVK